MLFSSEHTQVSANCPCVFIGDSSEAYPSLETPPRSAQCGSAPPHHVLFWNVYTVSCVFRQADIGPPIIGYSVVREKSLFIGPLSHASVYWLGDIFSLACCPFYIHLKHQHDEGYKERVCDLHTEWVIKIFLHIMPASCETTQIYI